MDIKALENLLSNKFNSDKFFTFVRELTKNLRQNSEELNSIDDDFYSIEPVSSFQDSNGLNFHVVIIHTSKPSKIEKAIIEQREVIRKYINQNLYTMPNGILAVFYNENYPLWRLSYTEIDWEEKGKQKTPPRRYSYLVGEGEPIHTPAKQLSNLIKNPPHTIDEIKEAFSVEKLTNEFFKHYRNLYLNLKERIEKEPANLKLTKYLEDNGYTVDDFAKKLLGQLVFLYFLQKKGWLGVPKNKPYGEGDKKFLRNLFEQAKKQNKNFYNDYLIYLFYDTLNNPRENQMIPDWSEYFNCRIPFLNGGLFEPIYDYKNILIHIDNQIFSNENEDGILDIFDIYNFTVKEDEPLEKEVAVDPEMLGKVFENLIAENERKGQGAFYTPREIVHYMSQQSIIYYLSDKLNLPLEDVRQIFTKENFDELPENIKENAKTIDNELKNIKIVDPACGSGAFLVGVLHEIIKARSLLNENSNPYQLKKEAIESSIYGVDIDIGATEIAKLRLWLSLIVDEENPYEIEPLPNLDYKIMCGNSLLEEIVIGDEAFTLFREKTQSTKSLPSAVDESLIKEKQILEEKFKVAVRERNLKDVNLLSEKLMKIDKELKKLEDKTEIENLHDDKTFFEDLVKLIKEETKEHILEKKVEIRNKINKKVQQYVLEILEDYKEQLEGKKRRLKERIEFFRYKNKREFNRLENEYFKTEYKLSEITRIKRNLDIKGCNKNFFLWHIYFRHVFDEKGGFDIVVANPPYVRQEKIKEEKPKFKAVGYQVYNSTADLYVYFYEKGYQILGDKGIYSFITSNKFMRAKYGKALREFLKKNTKLKNIIDFGGYQVFETATVDTVIVIGEKDKPNRNNIHICLIEDDFDKEKSLYEYCKEKGFEFPQKKLLSEVWTFEDLDIKEKIEKIGTPLKDWDVDIYFGIKTGFNNAFIIDEETRQKILANCKTEEERKRTEEIIKPVLRGRDIKRYYYKWAGLYLILIPAGWTNKNRKKQNPEQFFKSQFSSIYDYLRKVGDNFEKNSSGRRKGLYRRDDMGDYWWELRHCDYYEEFEKEKIIFSRIIKSPQFAYDDKGFYAEATTYTMTGENIKYLTALLNSPVVYWFFYEFYSGGGIDGEIKIYKLEQLPIPKIPEDQQKPFIELVDKILELTSR